MLLDDCYQLGEVIKTHGLKGEVRIHLDVDFPENYKKLESVFLLQEGQLVPFFVDSLQISGSGGILAFEDVSTIESAKQLVGCEIYLPLDDLPELPNGGFYFHELVGCKVLEGAEQLGTVKNIFDSGPNRLMEVDVSGREVLIPLVDEFLVSVDIKDRRIEVSLPDGLLDLDNA